VAFVLSIDVADFVNEVKSTLFIKITSPMAKLVKVWKYSNRQQ